jgi:glycosyltransferase involved in cell wall biosynthesis
MVMSLKKAGLEEEEPGGFKEKEGKYLEKGFWGVKKILNNFIFKIRKLVHQPLKLAIVTPQYVNRKGVSDKGVALHVFNLSRELIRLGCEVHIFTAGDKKSKTSFFEGSGKLVIHRINTTLGIPTDDYLVKKNLSRMTFDTKVVNEIMEEHHKGPFDLVHSHITYNGALMAKQLLNIKWVHTIHSIEKVRLKFMSKEERKFMKVSKWQESALSCADSVIAVSETLKKLIVENYGLDESKVFAIPNGVDSGIYVAPEKTSGKKVLYIGRFSMEKGIELLPEIIEGILSQDSEMIFEIVASLEEKNMAEEMVLIREELEELEKKYPGRLIWHKSNLSRKEISKLYSESMIFIQPSKYDSFPTTVLEAMLFGKPIIGSNVGGIPEMLGHAGVIISPKPFSFINSIIKLKNDPILMEKYSRRASERVKKYFWNKIAKQTFEFYSLLIKRKIDKDADLSHLFENLEGEDEKE